MKNIKMEPADIRNQDQLKAADAAIASGAAPQSMHDTASGASDLAGLDRLFSAPNSVRELAITVDVQMYRCTVDVQYRFDTFLFLLLNAAKN